MAEASSLFFIFFSFSYSFYKKSSVCQPQEFFPSRRRIFIRLTKYCCKWDGELCKLWIVCATVPQNLTKVTPDAIEIERKKIIICIENIFIIILVFFAFSGFAVAVTPLSRTYQKPRHKMAIKNRIKVARYSCEKSSLVITRMVLLFVLWSV